MTKSKYRAYAETKIAYDISENDFLKLIGADNRESVKSVELDSTLNEKFERVFRITTSKITN